MPLTYTNVVEPIGTSNPDGEVTRVVLATITFDSSYPNTGGTVGEPITAASITGTGVSPLSEITAVIPHSARTARQRPVWDRASGTLRLFIEDGTSGIEAQAANASDQSAVVCEAIIIGR